MPIRIVYWGAEAATGTRLGRALPSAPCFAGRSAKVTTSPLIRNLEDADVVAYKVAVASDGPLTSMPLLATGLHGDKQLF